MTYITGCTSFQKLISPFCLCLKYWEEHSSSPSILPSILLDFILTCILIYTFYKHASLTCTYTYMWVYIIRKISRKYVKNKYNACIYWFRTYIKCKTHLYPNFRTSQDTKKLKKRSISLLFLNPQRIKEQLLCSEYFSFFIKSFMKGQDTKMKTVWFYVNDCPVGSKVFSKPKALDICPH